MREIELTQDKYAIVDDEDFDELNRYKWSYHSMGYAVRTYKKKAILMHRVVNKTPPEMDTDHINRDKLDNRKKNLRTVDTSTNCYNKSIQPNNKSGYRCIHWDSKRRRWVVQVKINSINKNLGRYVELEDAIVVRDKYELEHRKKVLS